MNFQMNNLISLLAKSELLCESCTSNDTVTGRCVDCCKFMCEFCVDVHKRFLETRDHRLMSLAEVKMQGIPALSQQPKCDKHKGEVMKLYCESCKQLICRDCTIIDHREHCYQFIDDVAQQHKKSLKAALEDAVAARAELEKTKKLVEDMKTKVTAQCLNVEKDIEEVINRQITVLKQKETSLKTQVRKCAEERVKGLNEQAQDLEKKLKNMNCSVQFTQDVLQDNDNVTILSVSSEANNRLSSLVQELRHLNKQPCVQDNFNLNANQQSIERIIENGLGVREEAVSTYNLQPSAHHVLPNERPSSYQRSGIRRNAEKFLTNHRKTRPSGNGRVERLECMFGRVRSESDLEERLRH